MQELSVVIHNHAGLHARPAKYLVKLAKRFDSDVSIQYGEKVANAKSLISVLKLGVKTDEAIEFRIDGPDEVAASQEIKEAVHAGLGEGNTHQPAATTDSKEAAVQEKEAPPPPPSAAVADQSTLNGVGASTGIAIGPLVHLAKEEIVLPDGFRGVQAETTALQRAIASAKSAIEELYKRMHTKGSKEEAEIFAAHLEILEDDTLHEGVNKRIKAENNAAWAWLDEIEAQADELASLADELLAARAADLRDVGQRVLRLLTGAPPKKDLYAGQTEPIILAAVDLAPSDTAALDKEKVAGIATSAGGPNAHSAIIARALGIPAAVALGPGILSAAEGSVVILDGQTGVVHLAPTAAEVEEARQKLARQKAAIALARESAHLPAVTADGKEIEVAANAGSLKDTKVGAAAGADGIGLLRTEFIFLGARKAPSQEEQTKIYSDILQAMDGKPVIIRTMDIGGDKPVPYIQVPDEENPFLGERGIRLVLNRPELLRTQLRAIFAAAPHGTVRIMFPMIGRYEEWQAARQIVDEIRQESGAPEVQVGMMMELPSAALTAEAFAPEIDFFSIGTNDLTQYTMAIDRQHPTLAAQADGLHPAVLQLIQKTIDAAHAHGKWVGLCGELGSDPTAVPILLGMGIDELSISVTAVPQIKALIRTLSIEGCRPLAEKALHCRTAAEVRNL